jgi:hypothetical protein
MKNFRSPDGPDSNWNVAQPMAKPAGFAKKQPEQLLFPAWVIGRVGAQRRTAAR